MSKAEPINLIMVYTENTVDVEDFKKIAQRIKTLASNITVHIILDNALDAHQLEELAQHRTLVFSPLQLKNFSVNRGRVFAGRPMQKSEQLLRLQLAGTPVPPWTSLDRGKRLDPKIWGEYIITKPEISSRARGVRIVKTQELNTNNAKLKQFERGGQNFIIQQLIKNKTYSKIRIQTLFDEVLYARQFCFIDEVKFDTEEDMRNYESLFVSENTKASEYNSEEVFAMAKKCFDFFDDAPLLGLDVMLDEKGNPFFIEANPGGNTWHFSSSLIGQDLRRKGIFLETQFDAFNKAGDILAKRTLEHAI
jgi:hypothetical protein